MSLIVNDLAGTVRATKRELKARLPDVKKVFAEVEEHMRREVDDIVGARERGQALIPSVDFKAVRGGKVSDAVKAAIRRRGRDPQCVLARTGGGVERGHRRVSDQESLS
jgi:hypothetical protein